jgi:hypothetical protein
MSLTLALLNGLEKVATFIECANTTSIHERHHGRTNVRITSRCDAHFTLRITEGSIIACAIVLSQCNTFIH